ncbi:hypothetical protein PENSPDRAFT_660565 [Peniophora sp. CONT]|nr:hypothetical protein PENSPDRAFT_660565 [Peniophora sp. CONT]
MSELKTREEGVAKKSQMEPGINCNQRRRDERLYENSRWHSLLDRLKATSPSQDSKSGLGSDDALLMSRNGGQKGKGRAGITRCPRASPWRWKTSREQSRHGSHVARARPTSRLPWNFQVRPHHFTPAYTLKLGVVGGAIPIQCTSYARAAKADPPTPPASSDAHLHSVGVSHPSHLRLLATNDAKALAVPKPCRDVSYKVAGRCLANPGPDLGRYGHLSSSN